MKKISLQYRHCAHENFNITGLKMNPELILGKGLLSEEKLNEILDPYSMTEPGIRGKNPADVLR